MRGWLLGCSQCGALYDAQLPRCPCGEPTVLNRLALDREQTHQSIPARGWLWGGGIAIVMWLIFGYIVLKIDGGL